MIELTETERAVILKGLETLNNRGVTLQESAFILDLFRKVQGDGQRISDPA